MNIIAFLSSLFSSEPEKMSEDVRQRVGDQGVAVVSADFSKDCDDDSRIFFYPKLSTHSYGETGNESFSQRSEDVQGKYFHIHGNCTTR